jgi:2-methylisocitrate lyase-like PEP mutase family enzyme
VELRLPRRRPRPRRDARAHHRDRLPSDVPVNADFLNGFADEPEDLLPNVALCIGTGVAGISIEDMDANGQLYETELAVERIRAARKAIDEDGTGVFLVARCEAFLVGHPDALRIAVPRLERFADAGADCLYAPDVTRPEDIATIVRAVHPKPVNVLARNPGSLTVADLAALGVRRVSVGGGLARLAWTAVIHAAEQLAARGPLLRRVTTMPSRRDLARSSRRGRRGEHG